LATVRKHKEAHANSRGNISSLKLNIEEMTDNSGTLSDEAFFYKHGVQPMVPNAVRVDFLVEGIANSKRFQGVAGTFDQYDTEMRTVAQMLKLLHNVENSKNGQDILASEVAQLSKNKKLKEDNSNVQANYTSAGSKPSFAKGSCKFHPEATSHDTAHCNTKNSGGYNQNKSFNKTKDFKPCTYCKGIEKLKSNAASHSRETCYFDSASSHYKGPSVKNKSSFSSNMTELEKADVNAFMSTQVNVNSSIVASLSRLTAAIDKLNKPIVE